MEHKIIHVGLGEFGQNWEREVFQHVPDVTVAAWVDAKSSTLETARDSLGLPADRCFSSLADAMAAVDADSVLITAPQPVHIPLAIQALEAGKHALVEKPFAMSVDEALTAIELADRLGKILMVSQQYRHYPAIRRAAQIVATQELGALSRVKLDFRHFAGEDSPEMAWFYDIPHPMIYDMSIHHFDLMRLILGKDAANVFAKRTDPPWSKYKDEGATSALIEFDGGTVVSYSSSWMSTDRPTFWSGEWVMEFEQGVISFTSRAGGEAGISGDSMTIARVGQDPEVVALGTPDHWGRAAGLLAFARAIETGVEPETSARNNLGSLALMVAAARSTKTGQVEPVQRFA